MADNRPKSSGGSSDQVYGPGEHDEDDPLVELARIVSEDGDYFSPSSRGREPTAQERREPGFDAFSSELEAELMREFEQTNREEPAETGREPTGRTEERASHFGARPEQREEPRPAPEEPRFVSWQPEERHVIPPVEPEPEAAPSATYDPQDADILAALADELERDAGYSTSRQPAPEPRVSSRYGRQSGDDFEALLGGGLGNENVDWHGQRQPQAPAVPPTEYETAYEEETYQAEAYDREADAYEPGAYEPEAYEASPYEGEEAAYEPEREPYFEAADPDFDEQDDERREAEALGAEFPFLTDEALVTPADADGDGFDGLAAEERPHKKGKRKGLMALAGVLGVVVIGGGVFAMLGGQENGEPGSVPVISADGEPVKVAVENAGDSEGDQVGQAVFDRVSGRESNTDEQLVDRNEEPREIARIVLPNAQGGEDDGKISARISDDAQQPELGPEVTPIGPKKVRTVIVRPDGTIVQNSEQPAAAASSEPTEIAGPAPADEPQPVRVQSVRVGSDAAVESGNTLGSSPAPVQTGNELMAPTPSETTQVASLPAPRPTPPAMSAPAPTTTTTAAAPTAATQPQMAAPQPAAAPAQPAVTTADPSGWKVQVSSQRTADQARSAFSSLQRRFPSLLANQEPLVREADLGDKGVFYRVQIGPMADRNAAISLCENLKSAGGSCFVTR
ncbi:SPOR domain-containing protein [Afifella sp. IM 167]|uniref:SPOR domain-containing protein n=1 Tax=Afifella sp. IM 167 TaxID=2033586 RepID=UPI001CC95FFE|nr:SPOR domain-containing protein [Afifella sp. IM 167]MBZ8132562.1 hypothetical protein [Afifella sp. IM 167]